MATLVGIIIAIKYLLCNTLPEEPIIISEKPSVSAREPINLGLSDRTLGAVHNRPEDSHESPGKL